MPEFSLFKTFRLQEGAVIYIQKKAQCYVQLHINKTTKEISKINADGEEGLGAGKVWVAAEEKVFD